MWFFALVVTSAYLPGMHYCCRCGRMDTSFVAQLGAIVPSPLGAPLICQRFAIGELCDFDSPFCLLLLGYFLAAWWAFLLITLEHTVCWGAGSCCSWTFFIAALVLPRSLSPPPPPFGRESFKSFYAFTPFAWWRAFGWWWRRHIIFLKGLWVLTNLLRRVCGRRGGRGISSLSERCLFFL